MCTGAPASLACRPATNACSDAGGTARSECGATPVRVPASRTRSTMRNSVSTSVMKRRCSGSAGVPPKPLVRYSTGSNVSPMPARPAAAAMRNAVSAGSAYGAPCGSWCR